MQKRSLFTVQYTATPVASTQWCAFQTDLLALALFHAALRAFARDELPTDLGCFG